MAKSKDDIKFATARTRLNEDEATRVAYKAGTPLEGGKIANSEPIDLFASAHNIEKADRAQPQLDRASNQADEDRHPNTGPRQLPEKQSTVPGLAPAP